MQTVKQNPELIDRAKNETNVSDAQRLMLAIRDQIASHAEGNLSEEEYKQAIKQLLEEA